jgi:hypothetical protein
LGIEICFKPVIVGGEVKKESCEEKEEKHLPCLVTPSNTQHGELP